MQIDGRVPDFQGEAAYLMLALEPPGNVARDLVAYRRSLFAESGDASGYFLPELAPLAFARNARSSAAHREAARRAMAEAWKGVTGSFSSASTIASRGLLYLGLDGPLELLASKSREILRTLALEPCDEAPLEIGRGFFLRRSPASELATNSLAAAPRIAFRDCFLVLLRIRLGGDNFAASSWREIARSKRVTGPRGLPSRRVRS
jgi:hypothetical protein